MKRSEIFFDVIRVPADFVSVMVAGVLAYWLRLNPGVQRVRPAIFAVDMPFAEYLVLVAAVSLFNLVVFAVLGLYTLQATRRGIDEVTRIAAGITVSAMGIILMMFLRAELFESRFILMLAWALSIVTVILARRAVKEVQIGLYERGIGTHRVVLVGRNAAASNVQKFINREKKAGYKVVGLVEVPNQSILRSIMEKRGIDAVIQCDPEAPDEDNMLLLDFCEEHKIDFRYIPNYYSTLTSNVKMFTMFGYPIVELRRTPLDGWGRVVKRSMDIAGASVGLALMALPFAVIAFIISWDSPGPIFFRQKRIGRNKRPFRIFKFRTMVHDAEKKLQQVLPLNERKGPLFKIRNDPRITRVGKFLRRYRIDELPQLINVLKNDMSLIGPRPHLPEEVSRYRKEHRRLFTVKPGMTGLAQVSGSSDLSFDEEATLDIQYIEQWELKRDVQILFRTLWKLLFDRSAV